MKKAKLRNRPIGAFLIWNHVDELRSRFSKGYGSDASDIDHETRSGEAIKTIEDKIKFCLIRKDEIDETIKDLRKFVNEIEKLDQSGSEEES